jgi:hypothetical protein
MLLNHTQQKKTPSIKHCRSGLSAARCPNGEITGEKQNRLETVDPRSCKPPSRGKPYTPTTAKLPRKHNRAISSQAWLTKPAAADQNLPYEINTVRPENQWKKPKPSAILLAIASPAKPAANHELLFRNQTPGATNREKKRPPLHPTKRKNHVSISEKDEIKHINFISVVANDTPRGENETYLKARPKTTYWGGGKRKAPLLHYHAQKVIPRRGKIAREEKGKVPLVYPSQFPSTI